MNRQVDKSERIQTWAVLTPAVNTFHFICLICVFFFADTFIVIGEIAKSQAYAKVKNFIVKTWNKLDQWVQGPK